MHLRVLHTVSQKPLRVGFQLGSQYFRPITVDDSHTIEGRLWGQHSRPRPNFILPEPSAQQQGPGQPSARQPRDTRTSYQNQPPEGTTIEEYMQRIDALNREHAYELKRRAKASKPRASETLPTSRINYGDTKEATSGSASSEPVPPVPVLPSPGLDTSSLSHAPPLTRVSSPYYLPSSVYDPNVTQFATNEEAQEEKEANAAADQARGRMPNRDEQPLTSLYRPVPLLRDQSKTPASNASNLPTTQQPNQPLETSVDISALQDQTLDDGANDGAFSEQYISVKNAKQALQREMMAHQNSESSGPILAAESYYSRPHRGGFRKGALLSPTTGPPSSISSLPKESLPSHEDQMYGSNVEGSPVSKRSRSRLALDSPVLPGPSAPSTASPSVSVSTSRMGLNPHAKVFMLPATCYSNAVSSAPSVNETMVAEEVTAPKSGSSSTIATTQDKQHGQPSTHQQKYKKGRTAKAKLPVLSNDSGKSSVRSNNAGSGQDKKGKGNAPIRPIAQEAQPAPNALPPRPKQRTNKVHDTWRKKPVNQPSNPRSYAPPRGQMGTTMPSLGSQDFPSLAQIKPPVLGSGPASDAWANDLSSFGRRPSTSSEKKAATGVLALTQPQTQTAKKNDMGSSQKPSGDSNARHGPSSTQSTTPTNPGPSESGSTEISWSGIVAKKSLGMAIPGQPSSSGSSTSTASGSSQSKEKKEGKKSATWSGLLTQKKKGDKGRKTPPDSERKSG
ncbi:hypothetical protein F4677DRAFT_302255 [Hypoxylon crocopeplum]|nr:hypothetical protein F4677DRAFT_302255 [Hypoxylon crocopeplum]